MLGCLDVSCYQKGTLVFADGKVGRTTDEKNLPSAKLDATPR